MLIFAVPRSDTYALTLIYIVILWLLYNDALLTYGFHALSLGNEGGFFVDLVLVVCVFLIVFLGRLLFDELGVEMGRINDLW